MAEQSSKLLEPTRNKGFQKYLDYGTFQKRPVEVATVYKEMKRPQQLVVDMMEDTVQSVQCIQYNTV
jgi:hypothetical protein